MGLSSHANVYNSCLLILRDRGFELEVSGDQKDAGGYPTDLLWIARKDGFTFSADNPIELLGLVAIFDIKQPAEDRSYWWTVEGPEDRSYWWTVEGPDVWTQLMEIAFPDKDA